MNGLQVGGRQDWNLFLDRPSLCLLAWVVFVRKRSQKHCEGVPTHCRNVSSHPQMKWRDASWSKVTKSPDCHKTSLSQENEYSFTFHHHLHSLTEILLDSFVALICRLWSNDLKPRLSPHQTWPISAHSLAKSDFSPCVMCHTAGWEGEKEEEVTFQTSLQCLFLPFHPPAEWSRDKKRSHIWSCERGGRTWRQPAPQNRTETRAWPHMSDSVALRWHNSCLLLVYLYIRSKSAIVVVFTWLKLRKSHSALRIPPLECS